MTDEIETRKKRRHHKLEIDSDQLKKLVENALETPPLKVTGNDYYTYIISLDGKTKEYQTFDRDGEVPPAIKALWYYFEWK